MAGGAAKIASRYRPGDRLDTVYIVCGLVVSGFAAFMAEHALCALYTPSDNMLTFVDGMAGFAASAVLNKLSDVMLTVFAGAPK